jgi:hypothetical protein
MKIHDFYSKLTSVTEGGHLFQALRTLSQIEDPKQVLYADTDTTLGEWTAWPPMGDPAACLAA